MTIREQIHEIFEISEPHELPARLMEIVSDQQKLETAKDRYRAKFPDLSHDYLRDYFQDGMADRSNLMQDYTPESICQIVAKVAGKAERVADLCAGTGSLTLQAWQENPDAEFICYEISSASIPFLLFNLSLRSIRATVVHGDVLANEAKAIYRCQNGQISTLEELEHTQVDAVISNPPYSLKWSGTRDYRFGAYETPPKKAADFAFALIGMSMLRPEGKAVFILPHGVLFRQGAEEKIRKQLLDDHRIKSVIGLPPALFANTPIPVCIMELQQSDDGVFIIDASEEMKKRKKINLMEAGNIKTVLSVYGLRRDVDKLAHLASYKEIEENDGNLNIPRYVDKYEKIEYDPPEEILRNLIEYRKQIKAEGRELFEQLKSLTGEEKESMKLQKFLPMFEEWVNL